MANGEAEAGSESHASPPAPGAESGRAVNAFNPEFIDEMYASWKADAHSVSDDWNRFFLGFELGLDRDSTAGATGASIPEHHHPDSESGHPKQGRVLSLIHI